MAEYAEAGNESTRWKEVGQGAITTDAAAGTVVTILQQSSGLPLKLVATADLANPAKYAVADGDTPVPEATTHHPVRRSWRIRENTCCRYWGS
jgi:hypothetical protein